MNQKQKEINLILEAKRVSDQNTAWRQYNSGLNARSKQSQNSLKPIIKQIKKI